MMMRVKLLSVGTVQDDGVTSRAIDTKDHVLSQLADLNKCFAGANIEFVLGGILGPIKGTAISQDEGANDEQARTDYANQFPDHLVIFVRHDATPLAAGYSAPWSAYAVMPQGAESNLLAHELGHFFGLPHTFVENHALDPGMDLPRFGGHGVVRRRGSLVSCW